jgi:phenylacetate-CoA ligase
MKLIESIYHLMPIPLQNFGTSVFGFYWYKRRFGGVFQKELKVAKEREFFNEEEWHHYNEFQLKNLLSHCFKYVPYYDELFRSCGLTQEKLENFKLEMLKDIPILEKQTFRILGQTTMISNILESNIKYIFTSGSTGTPLKIFYSLKMQQTYAAIYERSVRNWAGVNYKMGRGVFGGRRILKHGQSPGPFHRYNFVENQVYFSSYHISKITVNEYLEALSKYKLDYLEGYTSAIYFLAKIIKENNLKPPHFKAILGSTDKLTLEMRELISEVFDCKVFDSYNGVDLCNLISECEHHKLHIVPDIGYVEILNEKGDECSPGEIGELICTGYLNYNQPLVRYRIGDLVKLAENQSCKCGRTMKIVEEIVGRIEDVVVGVDGRQMRRFNRVFIGIDSILEGQIIQHEIDSIEIKLVVNGLLSENEKKLIKDRIHSQLGEINVSISVVDNIPRGPNGKFKSVISMVKQNSNGVHN